MKKKYAKKKNNKTGLIINISAQTQQTSEHIFFFLIKPFARAKKKGFYKNAGKKISLLQQYDTDAKYLGQCLFLN